VPDVPVPPLVKWCSIPDFSRYEIASDGRVRNAVTGRILRANGSDGSVVLSRDSIPYIYKPGQGAPRQIQTGTRPGRQPYHKPLGLTRGIRKPDAFYTVYCLIDPRDFTPLYVGRTKSPRGRHADHLTPSGWTLQSDAYIAKMKELRALNLLPYFGVLEETTDRFREGFHITALRALGYELTNRNTLTGYTPDYVTPNPPAKKPPVPVRMSPAERKALSASTRANLSWNQKDAA
jgi:hypothetical protein